MKIRKRNQGGFIVTIELLVLATVLVLGLIVGWTSLRDSVLAELSDLSESIGALDQSYSILGVQNNAQTAETLGSAWHDGQDTASTGGTIDVQATPGDSNTEYTFSSVKGNANTSEGTTTLTF
jgi:hypothetical protein